MILGRESCKKLEGELKMQIKVKQLKNKQFIGYVSVGKQNVYAIMNTSINEVLTGLNEWLTTVAKKKNTIFC
jgi:hypothetical protein